MQVLGLAAIEEFLVKNAAARAPMSRWVEIAEAGAWQDITDMRRTLPSADAIKGTSLTCFHIGGNKFRLVAIVSYQRQEIVIEELLTHAQYSRKYAR